MVGSNLPHIGLAPVLNHACADRLDHSIHLRQQRWTSLLPVELRGQTGLHAVAKRSELSRIFPAAQSYAES